MTHYTGVTARGIITPIFKQGDNLIDSVCEALLRSAQGEVFSLDDGDIVGITESVVARTQGNYATCEQIAADIRRKFGGGTLGAVFPILSRNRFSTLLKALAMGCDTLYLQLSYPADEVGNHLIDPDRMLDSGLDPRQPLDEAGFRRVFGQDTAHPFTGVDYIEYYKSFGDNIHIIFSNDPAHILSHVKNVLCCDIHSRERTKRRLLRSGADKVYTLADILRESVEGSGSNPDYGLLGSNMSTEDSVKLFPRDCQALVDGLQAKLREVTGKNVEILIYGDGCFKDPVGGIWELADPVVSPAFTAGLDGTPNEIKIKYFADNELSGLSGAELDEAIRQRVADKGSHLTGQMAAQGTTPRRYTDLVGSLCDLVSGSGDRGTPVILIKGYFNNYASR